MFWKVAKAKQFYFYSQMKLEIKGIKLKRLSSPRIEKCSISTACNINPLIFSNGDLCYNYAENLSVQVSSLLLWIQMSFRSPYSLLKDFHFARF